MIRQREPAQEQYQTKGVVFPPKPVVSGDFKIGTTELSEREMGKAQRPMNKRRVNRLKNVVYGSTLIIVIYIFLDIKQARS